MRTTIDGVTISHTEHGSGIPILALHGAGVDHREIEAALEPVVRDGPYRRIYPDLPGMGATTAQGLKDNNDVVALLCRFIAEVAGAPALLLGHSYGAYLARGVASRRPELVRGLALVCPIGSGSADTATDVVVHHDDAAYDELAPGQQKGFEEYFVVRSRATARRYRRHVAPGTDLVDEVALARIFAGWSIKLGPAPQVPTLILAGRRDTTAGWRDAVGLLDQSPSATLTVVEDAGHALMHERPELFASMVRDWVRRCTAPAGLGR